MPYIYLLRPKQWAKNLFLFIPLFFSGHLFDWEVYPPLIGGFIAFSFIASSVYILNDYNDRADDRLHPVKRFRPLASGAVSPGAALALCAILVVAGLGIAWFIKSKFLFVLSIYFIINLAYSFGLKKISILDVILVAVGFVLRVKAGGVIANIAISEWLIIMVFLLALFMAIGKRRDDVLLTMQSGVDMRKSVKGYNLEYLHVMISLVCAVIIVAYLMYAMSPEVQNRFYFISGRSGIREHSGVYRLYYTMLFVLAGILRYLQIIFVQKDAGSPTKIFLKDRFLQMTVLLWIISFYFIIYVKNISIF